jgi:hypothetical protein
VEDQILEMSADEVGEGPALAAVVVSGGVLSELCNLIVSSVVSEFSLFSVAI